LKKGAGGRRHNVSKRGEGEREFRGGVWVRSFGEQLSRERGGKRKKSLWGEPEE